jgi:Rad3-related DNA helicase
MTKKEKPPTREEVLHAAEKAQLKMQNGMDVTKEICDVLNYETAGYTLEDYANDMTRDLEYVENLIGEKLSPFFLVRQEQVVRAVKLTYEQFKDSYFNFVTDKTEDNCTKLWEYFGRFLDTTSFMSHAAAEEFGSELKEDVPEFQDFFELNWDEYDDAQGMQKYMEKVFPHIEHFIEASEKALAERDERICKAIPMYDLALYFKIHCPIVIICKEK